MTISKKYNFVAKATELAWHYSSRIRICRDFLQKKLQSFIYIKRFIKIK